MRWRVISLFLTLVLPLALAAGPARAQLGLPGPGPAIGGVTGTIDRTLEGAGDRLGETTGALAGAPPLRSVRALARERIARLDRFIRAHPDTIERDAMGMPARRGIVLLLDPDDAALAQARALGFSAEPAAPLPNLGLTPVALHAPRGMALSTALSTLRAALPGKTLDSDPIHFPGGAAVGKAKAGASAAPSSLSTAVGLIDGGVADAIPAAARRGFAQAGSVADDHGTALAALLRGAGVTRILAADVYGGDPAGGGALAIARALDWLAGQHVRIVSISLVGPRNALLERAILAARGKGLAIFAAVGNDGPAAPPAYPASYDGVFAITGVDGRDRALIEAGKALHLDYAAPGADLRAPDRRGRMRSWRGTSFAVPLAAARAAAALDAGRALRAALDAEARDLGPKGPDAAYGRGLLCGACAAR